LSARSIPRTALIEITDTYLVNIQAIISTDTQILLEASLLYVQKLVTKLANWNPYMPYSINLDKSTERLMRSFKHVLSTLYFTRW